MTLNAQNVQSNVLTTSGGLQAGTTTSGLGGNTFYGYQSGKVNTTGVYNTFIGSQSGNSSSIGSGNTYIGHLSGTSNNGTSNTFVGQYSGGDTSGNFNVYVGCGSGSENTGGSGNVFIGDHTGNDQIARSNTLIIGNNELKQLIWGDFANDKLKFNAKVGIGFGFGNYPTTSGSVNVSNYNLFVKGGVLTEEVRVSLQSTWADYVFSKNYNLPKLSEVETFIAKNGHLQNVPSAKEVKENGIELGEMARIQQEKIEELTLYLIQQNKEIEVLKIQNKEIEKLKVLVNQLISKK